MRYLTLLAVLAFAIPAPLGAQDAPFAVRLEEMSVEGLPGIQSYAYGQHENLWVVMGGRTDGLHRRQPWASFDEAGHNRDILVIDPEGERFWHAPIHTLPLHQQDQLSATNMEFQQDGSTLYLVGGYGYSQTVDDKITYAMLTAVDVPGLIQAVQMGAPIAPYFRSLTDTRFAVTGGHLNKIDDTYYLVGGQKFDGNYNPMNHGTFVQAYTDAVRRFRLQDDGGQLTVTHLPEWTDAAALHRRDYNVVDQIMPDGTPGLTAFSGVFRPDVDLPFLNSVNITPGGYEVNDQFAQYFNHYHCAHLPVYAGADNEMHTVFFGGIAQYYEEGGNLVQDNDVPFVRTIARVTRDGEGQMTEYKLPADMPGWLGASAEFIPHPDVPRSANGVVLLDELPDTPVLAGYIFGGIESTAPNIFWINTGTESIATPKIFKVYLTRTMTTAADRVNDQSRNGLQLQVYPNPADGIITIRFFVDRPAPMTLQITDVKGRSLHREDITDLLQAGENLLTRTLGNLTPGQVCLVSLTYPEGVVTQKVILR